MVICPPWDPCPPVKEVSAVESSKAPTSAKLRVAPTYRNNFLRQSTLRVLLGFVCAVEYRAEKAPVYSCLRHHGTVLLVVSAVAHDGYDGIVASRQIRKVQELHGPRCGERLLLVVQHKGMGVHAGLQGRECAQTRWLRDCGKLRGVLFHGTLVRFRLNISSTYCTCVPAQHQTNLSSSI